MAHPHLPDFEPPTSGDCNASNGFCLCLQLSPRGSELDTRPILQRAAVLLIALVTTVFCGSHVRAAASDYPDRPIQLVVPYAAGGATDTVARLLQQGMEKQLGQPIVVVNRTGGNTIVGTQFVAHATPDGYTIVMVSVPHAANFTLYKHMPDAQSDFAPIAEVTDTPSVLVVNPSLPGEFAL